MFICYYTFTKNITQIKEIEIISLRTQNEAAPLCL